MSWCWQTTRNPADKTHPLDPDAIVALLVLVRRQCSCPWQRMGTRRLDFLKARCERKGIRKPQLAAGF